jgi:hypothetical protein
VCGPRGARDASSIEGDRVEFVKMVEYDRPRFFVVGVGHRFRIEREVTTSVALALMKSLPCRYEWKRAGKEVS